MCVCVYIYSMKTPARPPFGEAETMPKHDSAKERQWSAAYSYFRAQLRLHLGAMTLLVAPCITTSNKKLLVTKGITTRSTCSPSTVDPNVTEASGQHLIQALLVGWTNSQRLCERPLWLAEVINLKRLFKLARVFGSPGSFKGF